MFMEPLLCAEPSHPPDFVVLAAASSFPGRTRFSATASGCGDRAAETVISFLPL